MFSLGLWSIVYCQDCLLPYWKFMCVHLYTCLPLHIQRFWKGHLKVLTVQTGLNITVAHIRLSTNNSKPRVMYVLVNSCIVLSIARHYKEHFPYIGITCQIKGLYRWEPLSLDTWYLWFSNNSQYTSSELQMMFDETIISTKAAHYK